MRKPLTRGAGRRCRARTRTHDRRARHKPTRAGTSAGASAVASPRSGGTQHLSPSRLGPRHHTRRRRAGHWHCCRRHRRPRRAGCLPRESGRRRGGRCARHDRRDANKGLLSIAQRADCAVTCGKGEGAARRDDAATAEGLNDEAGAEPQHRVCRDGKGVGAGLNAVGEGLVCAEHGRVCFVDVEIDGGWVWGGRGPGDDERLAWVDGGAWSGGRDRQGGDGGEDAEDRRSEGEETHGWLLLEEERKIEVAETGQGCNGCLQARKINTIVKSQSLTRPRPYVGAPKP